MHQNAALDVPLDRGVCCITSPALCRAMILIGPNTLKAADLIPQVLLTLLGGRPNSGGGTSGFPFRVRALACRCLRGLARDPAIRDILATLQARHSSIALPFVAAAVKVSAAAFRKGAALPWQCTNVQNPEFMSSLLACRH